MTKREQELLEIIKENPYISQNELADLLNIKRSSVAVHISNLIKKGYLVGRAYVINSNLSKEVCVIGGCNIDFIAKSFEKINMKDSNPGTLEYSFGGVGKNIAENLLKMGIDNKFISVFGDDVYSREIKDYLKKIGLDFSNSKFLTNRGMSNYISILDENNDLFTAISSMEVLDEINIEFISKLIDLIKSYKYIVMDTNLREDVLEYICKNCPNSKIIVDCVSRKKALKIKKLLKYIYLLKPNIYEAEELTDIPYENESDLEKIVNVFLEKGVQKVFISMGEKGILYADKNENGIVKITEKPKIENTSGCGDSAMSGIIFGVVNEKDILECAKLGNIAGFITAQSMDTVSKNISEKNLLNFGGSYEIRKIFNS